MKAYARLLRLSNAPTAVADVWMGFAVVTSALEATAPLVLLTVASLCLYHGGMAQNDAFDARRDAKENRGRPIAEGWISRRQADRLANVLIVLGVALAAVASWLTGSWVAVVVALVLSLTVAIYNSSLKRTLLGPVVMAGCRVLNVGLGMAATMPDAALAASEMTPLVGGGLFFYVAGVTLFARDETKEGHRPTLVAGILLCLAGIAWLALAPRWLPTPRVEVTSLAWALFWGVTALMTTRGMVAGILQPTPKTIGRGIGLAIQGIVVIDAVLASLYAGPAAGLAIFALLPLVMLLGLKIPQT